MNILDHFQLEQLKILGFTREYQILFGLAFSFLVLFLVIKPMTLFLHHRHYTIVFTYVISSLLMLSFLFIIAISKEDMEFIKLGLEGMAVFGLCCVVYLLYRKLKHAYR